MQMHQHDNERSFVATPICSLCRQHMELDSAVTLRGIAQVIFSCRSCKPLQLKECLEEALAG